MAENVSATRSSDGESLNFLTLVFILERIGALIAALRLLTLRAFLALASIGIVSFTTVNLGARLYPITSEFPRDKAKKPHYKNRQMGLY